MRIEDDVKLDFDDVLIRPKRSELQSRSEVDLVKSYKFKNGGWHKGIPIMASNMDTVGTFEMSKELTKFDLSTCLHKHYSVDELVQHYMTQGDKSYFQTWYSMGITDQDFEKLDQFIKEWHKKQPGGLVSFKICLDVANGYQENFDASIRRLRDYLNKSEIVVGADSVIMAGNVVTADMTEQLILAGADIVKVGIGPGSVCTTRTKTGVGYPQLSAIIECADAAHGLRGHICADGGCRIPGDVAKAFGAGADFIMLGGMLAGHDECGGEQNNIKSLKDEVQVNVDWVNKATPRKYVYKLNDEIIKIDYMPHSDQKIWDKLPDHFFDFTPTGTMKFYGMSSTEAQEKHNSGVAEYKASEGKSVEVIYKGPVKDTVKEILGGLRSSCTYTGARTLKEMPKRTTFIRVNRQKNDIFGTDL